MFVIINICVGSPCIVYISSSAYFINNRSNIYQLKSIDVIITIPRALDG